MTQESKEKYIKQAVKIADLSIQFLDQETEIYTEGTISNKEAFKKEKKYIILSLIDMFNICQEDSLLTLISAMLDLASNDLYRLQELIEIMVMKRAVDAAIDEKYSDDVFKGAPIV